MRNAFTTRRHVARGFSLVFVLASLAGSVSCGDDGGPAAPTATVTSITVTGANLVHIGATEAYTASATLSNGSSQVPTCVWGGDTLSVATVDQGTGRVTGVASGEITIWCDAQGTRGTKRLRVLPNYQGTWLGSYAIESCEQTGDFARVNFCRDFTRDRVLPTSANLTQQNDSVSGVFNLGQIQGQQASGPIALDGTLRLSVVHVGTSTFTITSNWVVNSTRAGQIGGSMLQIWREALSVGEGRIFSRVFNTNRQLNASGLLVPRPASRPMSFRELIDLIAR